MPRPHSLLPITVAFGLALVLAGCGGSSDHSGTSAHVTINIPPAASGGATSSAPSATTAASPNRTAATTSTRTAATPPATTGASSPTKTTTAAGAKPASRTSRQHPRKPVQSASALAAAQAKSRAKKAAAPKAGVPPTAHVSGPTPNVCLNASGLLNPHAIATGEWEALSPATQVPVFVQGPYLTAAEAQAYAQTYTGINLVAPGGLYVASADLTSHLQFWVNAVAKCLSQTSGSGTISF